MWLRHHPHGFVLVHRVYASGCDRPAAGGPLPHDGHHEGWRCMVPIALCDSSLHGNVSEAALMCVKHVVSLNSRRVISAFVIH